MGGAFLGTADRVGRKALGLFSWVPASAGLLLAVLGQVLWGRRLARRVQLQQARRQVLFTGVQALPMITAISAVLGATLIVESLPTVPKVGAESLLSTIWIHVIVREIGPLLAGLIVTGRTGGAVAADLGCMKAGIDDLKTHPFFRDINWDKMFERKLPVPFIPVIKDPLDTSNFEEYCEDDHCEPYQGSQDWCKDF